MASANSNVQMVDLDFNNIKTNLRKFLQSQDTLSDYNYEGSALSTLLDILAYNTQYNAYYLNMVSNEMFLDTAIQRGSVVSHAKALNYTPRSYVAPVATVNLNFYAVLDGSLTLPKFTNFMSHAIDGVNYNFVNTDEITVNTVNNVVSFNNLKLTQGIPTRLTYQVDSGTNPTYTFEIPETSVDTSTISISVQTSYTNTATQVYTLATDYLSLDGNSTVYFLQESLNGTYQIYFGDGIIGKKLSDGNIISVSYIVTQGSAAYGANSFVLMDNVSNYSTYTIEPISGASQGSEKESIESIKFQAPKSYAAQNRAVTKEDYITIIQQNKYNIPVQAVSVWGGEESNPPKYGSIIAAVKPTGAYTLTDYQKQVLINDVIKPVSVMTVLPEIVDPDYVYLIVAADILYDQRKTTLTSSQISNLVRQAIITFGNQNLNTFNSTFVIGSLIQYVQNLDSSIVAVDFDLRLQKRIVPILDNNLVYTVQFGNAIEQGLGNRQVQISPTFSQYDTSGQLVNDVFFEESLTYPGTLRTYYYKNNTKYILTDSTATLNAGTIDYANGTVTLTNFTPHKVNSNDGLIKVSASPAIRIVSSLYDRIVTLDNNDPLAISVNVTTN